MKNYKLYDLRLMSMSRPPPRLEQSGPESYPKYTEETVCNYFGIDSYGNKVDITLRGKNAGCLTNEETIVNLLK